MAKKREKEKTDELGFTPSDYCDMQKLLDQKGKQGDELINGWDVTPEQITLINSPRHPLHAVAVVCFYDVNFILLRRMAFGFLKHSEYLLTVVDFEDLLQQLYCDLLGGFLKLPHNTEQIKKAIYKCFRFTAVGGLEGVDNVKDKRALRATA